MSPAGLKGVADEAGREMVIVCGAAMGDIFRRNALNLGLTVVQSREAVEDAQEGDAFSFDPKTRKLSNETRGKTYEPAALSPQEEEIRRSGGIIKIGRREFPESVRDRKSTRLNSSHTVISYAVFCLKKKKEYNWTYERCSLKSK